MSRDKTTEKDRQRYRRIQKIGCIACRKLGYDSPAEIHHLNQGGHAGMKRLGNQFTIGLCPYHHRNHPGPSTRRAMEEIYGPSLAGASKRFREKFGTDDELLALQNELIGSRE